MTRGVNIVPFPIRLENRGLTGARLQEASTWAHGAGPPRCPAHCPTLAPAVELLVYDTSGQDVYQDQWPKHYAGRIAAMVLVFDLNDAASFR